MLKRLLVIAVDVVIPLQGFDDSLFLGFDYRTIEGSLDAKARPQTAIMGARGFEDREALDR
jgi:hypothetical protein